LIITIKYIFAVLLLLMIFIAPAWFAAQAKKSAPEQRVIRYANFGFGWTGVGWLFALWLATRK
jgi:hypothetical protein